MTKYVQIQLCNDGSKKKPIRSQVMEDDTGAVVY